MKRILSAVLACVMILSLAGCSKKPETVDLTWHQCPEAVRNYLSYVNKNPYSADDRSYTYINNEGFATESNRENTKPVGITVDDKTFYDTEPNKPTPFSTGKSEGTLTALDPLRWYNTTYRERNTNGYSGEFYDVGDNCRDLGGWKCESGHIKYGMLVRSGELNPDDKSLMVDKIGIKTEVSLLPISEQVSQSSPWGIDWVGNPTDIDFMYRIDDSVKNQWQLYLRTIFESVSNDKPVVFHCGAGADKTGTMAVMLMGILGCSEQDIDTDYELTSFIHYSDWRNRTYEGYINYINAIKAVPLAQGLTDSFQNRCISFALSLGITMDEVNAFKRACIKSSSDDEEEDSDSVTVINRLYNVTTDNPAKSVKEAHSYEAEVTADPGYTLKDARVSITMNERNASQYYSNGEISIPVVTGPLVISIQALPKDSKNLFNRREATDHARIRSTGALAEATDNQLVTGFIEAAAGDTIYYVSDKAATANDYDGSIGFYASDNTFLMLLLSVHTSAGGWHWAKDMKSGYVTIPTAYTDASGKKFDLRKTAKIRLCIPYQDTKNLKVYRLETPPVLD